MEVAALGREGQSGSLGRFELELERRRESKGAKPSPGNRPS